MEQTVLTVTQLNEYIKLKIDNDPLLNNVVVKGEMSNFVNHYKTGHFYFTLKDENSVLRGVMFKSYASLLKFVPKNGMKLIVRGRISSYVRDGQYQIYATDMQPDGIGALYIAFEQLKQKLRDEGLFNQEFKKPIPKYPQTVGIITSPTGAAIRDMINVSGRRFPLAKLILFPCLVQGDGAPSQLCSGIRFFNEKMPVDVIILGRGGGSLEELWAFNDERLARAIFASKIPIISAVGHETDFSISDFVADLRAPTPSAAAELALPEVGELKRKLSNVFDRMHLVCDTKIKRNREKFESLAKTRALTSLDAQIDDRRMMILQLEKDMAQNMSILLNKKRHSFEQKVAKIEALSPLAVLSRGYSAIFANGKVVTSAKAVNVGDKITVRTANGSFGAVVEKIEI